MLASSRRLWLLAMALVLTPRLGWCDGKLMPPRDYTGSLEERAQEALIIFHSSQEKGGATEDLILKVGVVGSTRVFAWVIPFPSQPEIAKEDAALFREVFDYVEARRQQLHSGHEGKSKLEGAKPAAEPERVEVLSRKTVGSYDTAVVRENVAGALNEWLKKEGFQTLPDADEVIAFYRKKGYVFACMKVSDAEIAKDQPVDLHPLRFTFKPGGRDGIYYPMKMTGLQKDRFDVNLCVFYGAWLNDKLSKFGYVHRGFSLHYRDWDSPACKPNAGKAYSAPQEDPFLRDQASRLPTLTKLIQKLHPGERYYLTNIQAHGLLPKDVREWADDLWLFPYYVERGFVPFDARPGEPASGAWPHEPAKGAEAESPDATASGVSRPQRTLAVVVGASALLVVVGLAVHRVRRRVPR